MLRHLRTWAYVASLGSSIRLVMHIAQIFRYFVLKTLADEGVFEYLKEPNTYGEILAHFGYVDSNYTEAMFEIIATDEHNMLIKEGNHYRTNPAEKLGTLDEVIARTDLRSRGFAMMSAGLTANIPKRLRGQPTDFQATFDAPGREIMQNFDAGLGQQFYATTRKAAFALLKNEEREWLRGKKLLEVGCGGGRETADLWLRFGGDIHIVAVDPVESLVQLADERFDSYVKEQDPNHPPITKANRPVFQPASATQLPFEDGEFDAAFYAYILHFTADPRKAVREITRVVRADGLVFGGQIMRSNRSKASIWADLIVRSNESCYGSFWPEEHEHWFAENGFACETVSPLGIFRAKGSGQRKPIGLLLGKLEESKVPVSA